MVHGETGHGCQGVRVLLPLPLPPPTLEVRQSNLVKGGGETRPVLTLNCQRLLQRLHSVVTGTPGQLGVDDLLNVLSHEGPGTLLCTVTEGLQTVAAFQHQGDLPPRQGHQLVGQVGEAGWTDLVSSYRMLVTPCCVKAGGHHDEVRVEVPSDGHHHGPEGGEILSVSHGGLQAPGPGNVDIGAESKPGPTLHTGPGAGVEVPVVVSMDADVEDAGVFVESFLCLKIITIKYQTF